MSNTELVNRSNQKVEVKNILANLNMKKKFEEVLGKKASSFMASIINVSNSKLKGVEPYSIISSSMIAATLDLPIDPNLGFAYIVPYNCKDKETGKWVKKAQFQLGYRGYVQLALRTSQYKNINVVEIYKGQLKSWNPLTEKLEFDFTNKEADEVIGYAGFFRLVNSFEKTVYWSKEDVLNHAKKYSKTPNKGPWKDDFNSMAKKTVLKDMIKKWGILSIEMQTAIITDQAIIKDGVLKNGDIESNIEYEDNPNTIDVDYEEELQEKANKKTIDIKALDKETQQTTIEGPGF